jgi:succinoglycan biosynthesis transport protein ExoP
MDYLSNGQNGGNGSGGYEHPLVPQIQPQAAYTIVNPASEQKGFSDLNVGRLLRKYWLLAAALLVVGAAAGFVSVVLSSALYKTRLLLEVQSPSMPRGTGFNETQPITEEDIQTQVNILQSSTFLKRGADRMQSETVPLAPTGRDLFSRLRQRIHPATQDPVEASKTGLYYATSTFQARPVIKTHLIELTCESTSPDVAAEFLNSMAAEFVDDSSRSRMTTAQKTSEWLAQQIEETKAKMEESEQHLREFVQASGNVFAGQDAPLDDVRLSSLKAELAKIQQERTLKQVRYELTLKNPPESLAEVLDDGVLRNYKAQIEELTRQRAALTTTYTAKYEKVKQVDAMLASVERAYNEQLSSTVKRIKNDYEASVTQEKRLNAEYNGQSQRVSSEAGKAAQYNSLRRDVDSQRTMYQNLLVQENESSLNSSVPVNPIRIVEASVRPDLPYTPRPVLNIAFGCVLSLVLAAGLVFIRERMDGSIKTPGASRMLFNVPELGVIPTLGYNGNSVATVNGRRDVLANGRDPSSATALLSWQSGPAFIIESFRSTLASILRNQVLGTPQKMILVTSPGPAEGKTTVVQHLGIALAETGRRVLIVDGDFRRPHLHKKFGLSNKWGLIDVLCDDRPLTDYSPEFLGVFTGLPGLSILPNRVSEHNVSKALYSPRLRTILESLIKQYDMVLLDAPPILSVADTRIMAPLADALIMVVRSGVTSRESALEAYQQIQEDGLTLLGTVLTDYDLSSDRRRQYYYDYGDPSKA